MKAKHRSVLCQNAVHNIISSRVKESTYASSVMKRHVNKELIMTEDYDSDVVRFSQTKRFCPYKYMCDFQKFKEKLPDNSEFHVSFSGKGVSDIEYQHALEVWNKFEMKTKKDYQICT